MLRNTTNLITIIIVLVIALMLSSCASKKPAPDAIDSATQTLQRSAASAYRNGRYQQAQTLYQNVLNAALTRDDAAQIIDARFSLALVATALGEYKLAHLHLDQAEAEGRARATRTARGSRHHPATGHDRLSQRRFSKRRSRYACADQ